MDKEFHIRLQVRIRELIKKWREEADEASKDIERFRHDLEMMRSTTLHITAIRIGTFRQCAAELEKLL